MKKTPPSKLVSWNVNGLRAALNKGFADFVASEKPDVLCLQETKVLPEQIGDWAWANGYEITWNPAEKKGYSGTAIMTRSVPLSVEIGMGKKAHDGEGRVITMEFPDFFVVTVYTPNSRDGLRRLPYRMKWDRDFRTFARNLDARKPTVICGDFNVAHEEIDIARPKANRKSPGFTDEERKGFTSLLRTGFLDSFRHFHPDEPEHYSWWSYRANARARNVGWRLDYFLVSESLENRMWNTRILTEIEGSDHCPVAVDIKRG